MYAIRRPVDNVYLVRERDRRRTRELVGFLLAALPVMAVLFAAIWANVETLRLGYQIEQLQRQRDLLLERRRQLESEKAEAGSLERIAEIARTRLGLSAPRAGQLIFVAHGALSPHAPGTLPAAPPPPTARPSPGTTGTEEGF